MTAKDPEKSQRRAMRPTFLPLVLEYARTKGVDADKLLQRFAISPAVETHPDIEVDLAKADELNEAIAKALGDPFLGIHVAVRYRRGAYQLIEFACRNSPDVRGAVLRLVRYAAFVNPAAAFTFTEAGSAGALSHRFAGLGRHASEFGVAVIFLLACELTRLAWTPDAVWFAHEAPAEIDELVSLFGTDRIRFGAQSNGLLIGRKVLDEPLPGADPALLRVLETEMTRQAPTRTAATSSQTVADTERALRLTLELGPPRIVNVAQALGTSVRTLQRQLEDAGTSFQEVVEQTRERLARHHARRAELSSTQMAFLLGYSDVTAFLRAFKRWTGGSPQEFRGGRSATRTRRTT